MSEDNILRFLSYYNAISSDWLLFGRGSMLRGVQEQSLHQSMTQSSSPTEDSVIYKMYQDQLKVAQEEKVDNKSLCKENGRIEERLRILEAKLQEYESQLGASKENAKGLDHAKNASIKKSSLRNNPNADSAIVP